MPLYAYRAIDKAGKEQKGSLTADNARAVRQKLRADGMLPVEVTESAHAHMSLGNLLKFKSVRGSSYLKVHELTLITRQLATLVGSGMPIEKSLVALAEQNHIQRVSNIVRGVRAKVVEGRSLAQALGEYPRAFNHIYCATVLAGEQSGHLKTALNSLADYAEKQYDMQQKIRQAAIYPSIMLSVSVVIVTFLLMYVVPQMVGVFQQTQHSLPLMTRILLSISNFLQGYYWLIALIFIVGGYAFARALRQERFRIKWHNLLLRMPLLGNLIKLINTARYIRTFGIMSHSGVPVLDAMHVASQVVEFIPIHKALQGSYEQVREGSSVHWSLEQTKYFAPMTLHLIASGEASGQLDEMLLHSADNQDREVSDFITNFVSLFEPAMIIVMGTVVLFIVLAVLLPIFEMEQFTG